MPELPPPRDHKLIQFSYTAGTWEGNVWGFLTSENPSPKKISTPQYEGRKEAHSARTVRMRRSEGGHAMLEKLQTKKDYNIMTLFFH